MKRAKSKSIFLPILGDLSLILLGGCLLLWADHVTSFISVTIGAIFLLYAIYVMIDYFRSQKKTASPLFTALGLCIAGLFLVLQNDFLKELVSFIVGFFVIVCGIVRLQNALKRQDVYAGYKRATILAGIEIFCGVLCLVGKIIVPDVFLQLIGAMLVLAGLTDAIGSLLIHYAPQKVEATAIEAEIVKEKPAKKSKKSQKA